MNVMCCGVEVDTPFCPRCGKHQQNDLIDALRELLVHVESTMIKYRNDANRIGSLGTVVGKQQFSTAKKAYTKWGRWYDALIQVVKEKETAGTEGEV